MLSDYCHYAVDTIYIATPSQYQNLAQKGVSGEFAYIKFELHRISVA